MAEIPNNVTNIPLWFSEGAVLHPWGFGRVRRAPMTTTLTGLALLMVATDPMPPPRDGTRPGYRLSAVDPEGAPVLFGPSPALGAP